MKSSEITSQEINFLEEIDKLCVEFAANAATADTSGPANKTLHGNILSLAKLGFFGAGVSKEYGGLELKDTTRREATERIAATCGVTAFAQAQLHSGAGFVGSSQNDSLKSELLPKFASGEVLCGVSFAHVRRSGPPSLTVKKVDGGYLFNGHAPWISDWSMMDSFILAGIIESTQEVLYTFVDKHKSADHLVASDPMQLAVMTASDTVSLDCIDLFIEDRYVLSVKEPGHMKRSDYCNITSHVTLPLGCARGSVGYLNALGTPVAKDAAGRLQAEIDTCREQSQTWGSSKADEPDYHSNALKARASAVNIALRAAETAIAASGGRAHLITHPAQRRLREAAFYSTMALTADTQGALVEIFTDAC
jgi:alkylation response protein AidB-like acyl-CoA dehydrogenase